MKFKFKWDPNQLSLGVESIDQQHKEIFDVANALVRDLLIGQATQKISDVMAFLRDHTKKHFADEEALMAKINYPHLEKHQEHHQSMLTTLAELEQKFDEEGPSLALAFELNEKISQWLMGHIMKEDRAIVEYLQENPPSADLVNPPVN